MIEADDFFRNLEKLQELPSGTVTGNESLEEIRWDSMAVVMFIAMADEKYSIAIQPSELAEATTVADLYRLLTPQK